MFMGSEHVPQGEVDKMLEAAGGNNNGSTNEDRTNYFEDVPSNALGFSTTTCAICCAVRIDSSL